MTRRWSAGASTARSRSHPARRAARAVSHGGYKLYAIRATSLFAHLGIQNGDTLVKLDGADIDDRDQLDHARTAKEFVFELVRRGDPFEVTITLK